MARTKEKGKGKGKGYAVRSVRTKEDRKRPSVFMRLKTDESFKGIALFEPDPELKDNPGYYEYYDHWDNQGNQYVPCAGDKCPFCAANDNPSTRALTTWYFPDASDVKDQVKIFTMNYGTINDVTDESEEEDGILGKTIRIKRLSDKGDYKVKIISGAKPLTKAKLKEAMKLVEEKIGDGGLPELVEKQLKSQMERIKALDALEDDDDEDDDEDETPTKRTGKGSKAKDEDEDDEDDDEDDEDEEDEDEDEDDDDDEDEDEEEDDEEDEDEDEDEDDDEEEESEISGVSYEVVKVNEKDEFFDLKDKDGEKVRMWLGEGVDIDYDDVKPGATVKLSAVADEENDFVITEIKATKKAGKGSTKDKGKGKGKGGKGKGGKKK